MTSFRYQALAANGSPVSGTIEAEDRKNALQLLGDQGLFPSTLEACHKSDGSPAARSQSPAAPAGPTGGRVKRKEVTAFTREMASLLGAGIPIPQALEGLAEEEESPALRSLLGELSESVRTGASFSDALAGHPRLFSDLYVSMVRVGEEAGALENVMTDLADLLEHEDEVRSEVTAAVAYPAFVMTFGILTVAVLLTVVLPRLFEMLEEMMDVLPMPTRVLLGVSEVLQQHGIWLLLLAAGAVYGVRRLLRTPRWALLWDTAKLRIPFIGPLFRASALSRFARTLGTLVQSGVSLLPALKIVEHTIGNLAIAAQVALVAEGARGGDSLAAPLRKLGLFPGTVIQMINVGEESGRLDTMLLKVADLEERHMRARSRTLISLIAPALILVVGALVGFIVIALLLPIFRMSHAIN